MGPGRFPSVSNQVSLLARLPAMKRAPLEFCSSVLLSARYLKCWLVALRSGITTSALAGNCFLAGADGLGANPVSHWRLPTMKPS
jgi:hypothetical protein